MFTPPHHWTKGSNRKIGGGKIDGYTRTGNRPYDGVVCTFEEDFKERITELPNLAQIHRLYFENVRHLTTQ